MMISSCSEGPNNTIIDEKDEHGFRRGRQYQKEGRNAEALSQFLSVIENRLKSDLSAPESHLEAGQIFLHHMDDPNEAIHHFKAYLRLKPDSKQASKVEGSIKTALKKFAQQLPGQPYSESIDRMDLMDFLKQIKEENLILKQKLAIANERIEALGGGAMAVAQRSQKARTEDPNFYMPPSQAQPVAIVESTSTPSTYTVKRGDSLYRISSKVYGSGAHWRVIYESNRDQLSSPQALRPGMELNIPSRESN